MFKDLREFLLHLDHQGEVAWVKEEVDWKYELGAIVRRTWDMYGDASPGLLFENIKGYQPVGPHRLFVSGLGRCHRLGMILGLERVGHCREIIAEWRKRCRQLIKPELLEKGPCKENKLVGSQVDLLKFPVPWWHSRDGGRYLGTVCQVVTRDPDSGWVNVGNYRLQVLDGASLGILLEEGRQHIGLHFSKYVARNEPMPVAVAIGGPPVCDLVSMSPFVAGVFEYEVAGALQGAPVELVEAELSDLLVPATAEIVIEGTIPPKERREEGPFGEFLGYHAEVPGPRPFIKVEAITYRDDPLLHGVLCSYPMTDLSWLNAVSYGTFAWDVLELMGVPGVIDVAPSVSSTAGHIVVSIKSLVKGQATMVANALWGTHRAHWGYKMVIVVDEDIDPWDLEQVDWAVWSRVKASEDIHVWPATKGGNLDPRVPPEEKGLWDRVLIDASRPRHWEPNPMWGSEGAYKGVPLRFPPVSRPDPNIMEMVNVRWPSYNIKPIRNFVGRPRGLFPQWWEPRFIQGLKDLSITP